MTASIWALVAITAFLLTTEHQAHVFGILPWLFVLACPIMHLLMHRHHDHGHDANHDESHGRGADENGNPAVVHSDHRGVS